MANLSSISLRPETIVTLNNIEINNAVTTSILITIVIASLSLIVYKGIKLAPGKLQVSMEVAIGMFYERLVDAYEGDKKMAAKHTALIFSLFIFIFIANQFSIIPLFQNFTINGIQAFKTPTSHLSLTLALAVITVLASHFIAFSISPINHLNNFLKFKEILKVRSLGDLGNVFLELFLSLLDLIGEFSKIISLSCRLFGNIFAGEVMAIVIAGISIYTGYIVPIPFYILGIFSGAIQAAVFSLLALAFISGMVANVRK